MGKSSKKAKQEDFKKPKLKVGKKKGLADNHTDTSFKSKAISLPNQSLTLDKSDQITNSRNLTIKELMNHAKHTNANVRKDAVIGIKELLKEHEQLKWIYLKELVECICKLILDEDKQVRKLNLELSSESICEMNKETISSYLDILILYTCNGMTHLYEDIREDSILFLNLWLNIEPKLASKYQNKILPNFFQLLKIGFTAKASHEKNPFSSAKGQIWSKKSRVHMLENLYNYFNWLSIEQLSGDWYFQTFLNDKKIEQVLKNYTHHQTISITDGTYLPNSIYFNDLLSKDTNFLTNFQTKDESVLIQSIPTLYNSLMSFWIESYSNVLIGTSKIIYSDDLKSLNCILKLLLWIWRFQIHHVKDSKNLDTYFDSLQKFVIPYFPFGNEMGVANDPKVVSIILEMNVAILEISGLYLLFQKNNDDLILPIFNYLLDTLSYKKQMVKNINKNVFCNLLPSITWLLNLADKNIVETLFQALIDFSIHSSNSQTQYEALSFLLKLIQLQSHPSFSGIIKIKDALDLTQSIDLWAKQLIKSLLNNLRSQKENEINKVMIQLLHHLIRFDYIQEYQTIQKEIIELFNIQDQKIILFNLEYQSFELFFNTLFYFAGLIKPLYNQIIQLKIIEDLNQVSLILPEPRYKNSIVKLLNELP